MNYHIKRDLNEYGPYTLADLQRYVAQGNILMADLTRSEGMADWVPVSQVLGNIPVPVPAPAGTVYAGTPGNYGSVGYGVAASPSMGAGPVPVDLHWALVLLFAVLSCWLFSHVWMIVEGVFIHKIKPQSKGLVLFIVGIACPFVGAFIASAARVSGHYEFVSVSPLFSLGGLVVQIVAAFTMRSDLEEYYNTTENINLRLSGVGSTLLTLFFPAFYFQWHLSRIAKWKKSGVLEPQP